MTHHNQTPNTPEPHEVPQELRPPEIAEHPLSERLRTVDETVRTFVREQPLAALGIALGAGFIVGKLITRRRGD